MKRALLLIVFIMFSVKQFKGLAQDHTEKITIDFGISQPFLKKQENESLNYKVDYEIEVLYNFRISNSIKLSTGVGIQSENHYKTQEVGKVVMVDGDGLSPWKYTYHWKLNSLSIKAPIFITIPFNTSYINYFSTGVSLGRFWKYNLTEQGIINPPHIKINRFYMDYSFGVMKKLAQDEKISIYISPMLGFRTYFTDFNNWQKNYVFCQLKLNINFKAHNYD